MYREEVNRAFIPHWQVSDEYDDDGGCWWLTVSHDGDCLVKVFGEVENARLVAEKIATALNREGVSPHE